MTKDDPTPKPPLPALFERAGGFRDLLLVCVGLFYALGLITWSYSALERHMGFMDALDAQYVIAGIIPSIPVLFLAFLFYTSLAYHYRKREVIRNLLIALCLVMAILQVSYATFTMSYRILTNEQITIFGDDKAQLAVTITNMLWYGSVMLFALSLLRWLPDFTYKGLYVNFFIRTILIGSIFGLFVLCNVEYAAKIFPIMPAEIGGGQPRCASLDLEKKKLSQATVHTLMKRVPPLKGEPKSIGDGGEIGKLGSPLTMHVENVWVGYLSDKTLLFKLPEDKEGSTFEIARSAISVVIWCPAISGQNFESECRCNIQ